MHLISIIVICVAVFAILSAVMVFFGSEKGYKFRASIFALFQIFLTLWIFDFLGFGKYFAWLLIALALYFLIFMVIRIKKSGRSRVKTGWKYLLASTIVAYVVSLVAMIALPFANIHVEWIAGLVVCAVDIMYYYCVLKYKVIGIYNVFMKIWSVIVMAAVFIIAYMCVFYFTSKYLFHVDSSVEIVSMNLLMVTLVVAMLPIFNEVYRSISSVLSTRKVDLAYIISKLNKVATQNVKYHDLASLIADHLHFDYIGLIVNGRLYNSRQMVVSAEDIAEISMLEASKGVWQKAEGHTKELFNKLGIEAVAELRDAKGKPFGQILVGKPLGKIAFEKRDLSEIELIINLIASVIDSKERLKA